MKIRVISLCTQIHGVSQLGKIEKILNGIGCENIIHISTIGLDMIVVYKCAEAD